MAEGTTDKEYLKALIDKNDEWTKYAIKTLDEKTDENKKMQQEYNLQHNNLQRDLKDQTASSISVKTFETHEKSMDEKFQRMQQELDGVKEFRYRSGGGKETELELRGQANWKIGIWILVILELIRLFGARLFGAGP